jgi:hypothetical protein
MSSSLLCAGIKSFDGGLHRTCVTDADMDNTCCEKAEAEPLSLVENAEVLRVVLYPWP